MQQIIRNENQLLWWTYCRIIGFINMVSKKTNLSKSKADNPSSLQLLTKIDRT